MLDFVEKSPDKLGGTPVFQGTRIPVYLLFDYLRDGYTIENFLRQYDIEPTLVYGFLDAWCPLAQETHKHLTHKRINADVLSGSSRTGPPPLC